MEQTAIERFLIYIKQQRLRQIGVDAVLVVRKEGEDERKPDYFNGGCNHG